MSDEFRTNGGLDHAALVLSGGGITGWFYELGCMRAWDERMPEGRRIRDFPLIIGTSAGAVLASMVAGGVAPTDIAEMVRDDAEHPLDFRREDIYAFHWTKVLGSLARGAADLPGLARGYLRTARRASPLDFFTHVQSEAPSGLFSNAPLDAYLRRFFDAHDIPLKFRDLDRDLRITATDLDRGEPFLFSRETTPDAEIPHAAVASSAIPMFFTPVAHEGRDLIDGSIAWSSGIELAIDAGAKLVVVLNPMVPLRNDRERVCLPAARGACASIRDLGFSSVGLQAFRVLVHTRLCTDVRRLREERPDVRIVVLEPTGEEALISLASPMAFSTRKEVLTLGYQATRRRLEGVNGDLEAVVTGADAEG
ncbi:MAG: patatin-like phospholipase family protein [Myxococcales bacterium]|nr:patatin-like phospholipase family protein [Myxococcales bacterium]